MSFGSLPEANKEGEEAKKEDPVEQEIIEETSTDPVATPEAPILNTNDI